MSRCSFSYEVLAVRVKPWKPCKDSLKSHESEDGRNKTFKEITVDFEKAGRTLHSSRYLNNSRERIMKKTPNGGSSLTYRREGVKATHGTKTSGFLNVSCVIIPKKRERKASVLQTSGFSWKETQACVFVISRLIGPT